MDKEYNITPSSANGEADVNTPCLAYRAMSVLWELPDDLVMGIEHMRTRSSKWLPREEKESTKAYKNRVARSGLYEAFKDTLEKHASKPFSRPVSFSKDVKLPSPLDRIWADVDRLGEDGDTFAKSLFKDAELHGLTHILVDFPTVDGPMTKAEEEQNDIRPIFTQILATDLIGWRTDEFGKLTQIRFRQRKMVPKGKWGEEIEHRVKVYNSDGTWEVWRKSDSESSEWVKSESGTHSFPGIPLTTVYFQREGFMTASPPMKKLAETNLLHYRSESAHRNFLSFARIGILFGRGFTKDEEEKGFVISPHHAIITSNEDADLRYVEVSGESITAGERDLKVLENRMEILGVQPLVQTTSGNTATGSAVNEAENNTVVQTWIIALEKGIRRAYQIAGQWVNEVIPEAYEVNIYSDFSIGGDSNESEFLLNSALAGKLPTKDFIEEIIRRNVLKADTNVGEVLERIKEEFPPGWNKDGIGDNSDSKGIEVKRKTTRNKVKDIMARSGKGPQSAQ